MKLTYDEDVDTLYVRVNNGEEKIEVSQQQGDFIFDFNVDGEIIGFEITTASAIINRMYKKVN
jgi:uncharacterized protein YuzE